MITATGPGERLHQHLFTALHGHALVYNTCWEDPALDREALRIVPGDVIAMITSAGCNALDYALLSPRTILSVDANPRQTALLELKIAGIRSLDFADFFAMFGEGSCPRIRELYRDALRQHLSAPSRVFWDRRLHWFLDQGWQRSFYFRGLAGTVARLFDLYLGRRPRLRSAIDDLLESPTLERQSAIYHERVEPLLWRGGLDWLLSRQATMSMLGVPSAQRQAVDASHGAGLIGFIRSAIAYVFARLPIADNYFWTVYLRGRYTRTCCPEYLKRHNFAKLKAGLVDCIQAQTGMLTDVLRQPGERISKFVLLDHQDWMVGHQPQALVDEWQAILARASGAARVIFRSAHNDERFLDAVDVEHAGRCGRLLDRLSFDRRLAQALHARDRVHTYASFHIADIAA
ncbi:MAG: BtaA family protein [Planctomycetes bacterium]|nr:BtaA family protein [Planctomycetota bacterium]